MKRKHKLDPAAKRNLTAVYPIPAAIGAAMIAIATPLQNAMAQAAAPGVTPAATSGATSGAASGTAQTATPNAATAQNTPGASAPAGAAPSTSIATLPTVRVLGIGETATGVLDGYIARRDITATKTDTPIIETPQSVSVVTRDQMTDQGATNLRQAFSYTPGLVDTGAGPVAAFVIRGFPAYADTGNYFLDGMKYASNAYQGQPELYGLERLELLRGPASVLYGNTAPGGIINAISKRPTLTPLHELNVEYGSYQRKVLSGDFGGKLTEDGVWSYRLTGLVQDSNTYVQHVPDDRTFIAPALTWAPSANTSLTLLTNYRKTHTRYLYGLPAKGTLEETPSGEIPTRRFIGEPDSDRYNEEAYSAGYIFKHRLSDKVQFTQNLRYEKSNTDLDYATFRSYADPADSIIRRGFAGRTIDAHALTVDTNVAVDWGSDFFANKTLVGFDYVKQNQDDDRWNADVANLDIYHPDYGSPLTRRRDSIAAQKLEQENMGVYLQNQAKIAQKWVVLLGGRYDWARTGNSPFNGPEEWNYEKNEKFTGRAGIVYLADNGLAPYVSYSQSFQPTLGTDRAGTQFKPTEGEQYEVGIRYQPNGSDTQITASVYQLTQKNILTPDPVDPTFQAQTGKARARGFELEATTALTRNLTLMAGYSYTSTKILKSNDPAEEGGPLPFAPRHQFSLWAIYDNLLGINGLKVGGGARYVGSTTSFYYVDADVSPYTVFDAMTSYTTGPWKFALNVRNLANKRYVANCTYGCFYGEPRTVVGTVGYRW